MIKSKVNKEKENVSNDKHCFDKDTIVFFVLELEESPLSFFDYCLGINCHADPSQGS